MKVFLSKGEPSKEEKLSFVSNLSFLESWCSISSKCHETLRIPRGYCSSGFNHVGEVPQAQHNLTSSLVLIFLCRQENPTKDSSNFSLRSVSLFPKVSLQMKILRLDLEFFEETSYCKKLTEEHVRSLPHELIH